MSSHHTYISIYRASYIATIKSASEDPMKTLIVLTWVNLAGMFDNVSLYHNIVNFLHRTELKLRAVLKAGFAGKVFYSL